MLTGGVVYSWSIEISRFSTNVSLYLGNGTRDVLEINRTICDAASMKVRFSLIMPEGSPWMKWTFGLCISTKRRYFIFKRLTLL